MQIALQQLQAHLPPGLKSSYNQLISKLVWNKKMPEADYPEVAKTALQYNMAWGTHFLPDFIISGSQEKLCMCKHD